MPVIAVAFINIVYASSSILRTCSPTPMPIAKMYVGSGTGEKTQGLRAVSGGGEHGWLKDTRVKMGKDETARRSARHPVRLEVLKAKAPVTSGGRAVSVTYTYT